MVNKKWYVIGLMSGTSLDGLDLAYVKIELNKGYHFEILETESINYSDIWKKRLSEAFDYSAEKMSFIDADYGKFLGREVLKFIEKNKLEKIDFIASHGHTIFHNPTEGYTLQIGNGAHLAAMTNQKVICDFRTQDVALGGQGAPLVPVGDHLLFSNHDFCLNLGGFANISYEMGMSRIAYDICPANIILNHFTRTIGLEFDDKGQLAAKGSVNTSLLNDLNNLSFYQELQPKSLGYEFIVESVFPIIKRFDLPLEDILATCIEHSAYQISTVVNKAIDQKEKEGTSMLVTGGGAFNDYLINRIASLSKVEIVIPSREIIEYKEALIFAFLGVLKNEEEINCLKSVTGARMDHSSGVIYSF